MILMHKNIKIGQKWSSYALLNSLRLSGSWPILGQILGILAQLYTCGLFVLTIISVKIDGKLAFRQNRPMLAILYTKIPRKTLKWPYLKT